jgi:two-component system response regulator AtoC
VGATETEQVDVRLILATHEKLDQLVAAGRFREDLYWRINVVAIELPPLRDRPADIPRLARHFLARAAAKADRAVHDFYAATIDRLLTHDWPGNVRELEHAIERAVLLGSGPVVELSDLPPRLVGLGRAGTPRGSAATLKDRLAAPERQLILDTLERHRWRRDAAARALGINRATLYKKAKRLGVDLASLPTASAG